MINSNIFPLDPTLIISDVLWVTNESLQEKVREVILQPGRVKRLFKSIICKYENMGSTKIRKEEEVSFQKFRGNVNGQGMGSVILLPKAEKQLKLKDLRVVNVWLTFKNVFVFVLVMCIFFQICRYVQFSIFIVRREKDIFKVALFQF